MTAKNTNRLTQKNKQASPKVGRPVENVPQDKADEICNWIAAGKPLREWCRIEGNPHFSSVYDWLTKDPEFTRRFAIARGVGEDVIAQECLDIADNATNDWMERNGSNGETGAGWALNGEHIQRSKLRIETRLKLLAKWNPKKYGDKVGHEVTGADGGPLQVIVKRYSADV